MKFEVNHSLVSFTASKPITYVITVYINKNKAVNKLDKLN